MTSRIFALTHLATLTLLTTTALYGCGGGGSSSGDEPVLGDDGEYLIISKTRLTSRGDLASNTYDHIESILGKGAIEAPDLYGSVNHHGVAHIVEAQDTQVGNYFEFHIHRDQDKDRDKTANSDRQRNEIKVYDQSDDALKGVLGTTFEYRWKFKVGDDLAVTSHFTHLFQLKAVSDSNDPISQPLLTITANTKRGNSGLEVRHVDSNDRKTELTHTSYHNIDWQTQIQGQWLEVFVRANYQQQGSLTLTITPLGSQQPLVELHRDNIEMWRSGEQGGSDKFVRPKWGIYRSLNDAANLNLEDSVSFADFTISQVELVQP